MRDFRQTCASDAEGTLCAHECVIIVYIMGAEKATAE